MDALQLQSLPSGSVSAAPLLAAFAGPSHAITTARCVLCATTVLHRPLFGQTFWATMPSLSDALSADTSRTVCEPCFDAWVEDEAAREAEFAAYVPEDLGFVEVQALDFCTNCGSVDYWGQMTVPEEEVSVDGYYYRESASCTECRLPF